MKVKICGLSRPSDIAAVNQYRPDYAGFIINFPKSHRSCTPEQVQALHAQLSPDIPARVSQKVGQSENPSNFLLMHAMGPNVAGVIGSAVAAGILINIFG